MPKQAPFVFMMDPAYVPQDAAVATTEFAKGMAQAVDDQQKRNPKKSMAAGFVPGIGNVQAAATVLNPEASASDRAWAVGGVVVGHSISKIIQKMFRARPSSVVKQDLITGPSGSAAARAHNILVHEQDVMWRGLPLNEVMDNTLDKAHVVSRMTDEAGERFGLIGRPGGDDIITAYPTLAATKVKPRPSNQSTAFPPINTVYVGVLSRGARATEGEVEGRLIHEMQHLAQYVEKFPRRFRGWSTKMDLPEGQTAWASGSIPKEVWNKYVTNPGEIMARVASDRASWPASLRKAVPLDKHLEIAEGMLGRELNRGWRITMFPVEPHQIMGYLDEITPGNKFYNPKLHAEHLDNVKATRDIWPDDTPAMVKKSK